MRLTKQTNYAVRILMYCAANGPQSTSRIADIAKAYSVSELFLFKILQPLVKGGLIHSIRGRNGGVQLGRGADTITLLDVVRLTEDGFSMAECFDEGGSDCPLLESCSLNAALREALDAFFGVLAKYSIADLVQTRPDIRALLNMFPLKAAS